MNETNIVEYEVLIEFPGTLHEVGDIIKVYEDGGMAYVVEVDGRSDKYDVRDFPEIYKKK